MYIFQQHNLFLKNWEICRRAGIGRQAGLRDQ